MGTESGADRAWPARHGGGYPPGWQVRYRGRRERTAPGEAGPERIGTIAGAALRDVHTSTTWVPVRPWRTVPDARSKLVRATDILDACPPGEPARTGAAEDDEHRDHAVVVELPGRRPGDSSPR